MESSPKEITLKTGEKILLRPAQRGDEAALRAFFKEVPEEDRLFLREDVSDPAVIKSWMTNLDHERIYPLLAFAGDEIIGDATLHCNPYGWSRHVGEVRAVVAPGWQRKGVGQALLRALVARAVDRGFEILEANVLEGQHSAQSAFEALGFHVETVLRNRAKDRTGRTRNVLVMTNDVNELWRRMEDMITDMEYNPRGY